MTEKVTFKIQFNSLVHEEIEVLLPKETKVY